MKLERIKKDPTQSRAEAFTNKLEALPIEEISLEGGITPHYISELSPPFSDTDWSELIDSISRNGQREPIVIYRNQIIDGRHRTKVMIELGLTTIKAKRLPHNTQIADMEAYVWDKMAHRNRTATQRAIQALKLWQKAKSSGSGLTQAQAVKQVNASPTLVTHAKKIHELRPQYIDVLYEGGKIELIHENHREYQTSLKKIRDHIEQHRDKVSKSDYIMTEDTKDAIETAQQIFAEVIANDRSINTEEILDKIAKAFVAKIYKVKEDELEADKNRKHRRFITDEILSEKRTKAPLDEPNEQTLFSPISENDPKTRPQRS